MRKVFISYSHQQGTWVWDRLVPCLRAGGAEPILDRERFRAGHDLHRQMDMEQDSSQKQLLIHSPAYLDSQACRHELKRAIAADPNREGVSIAVLRESCEIDDNLKKGLFVDLRDDSDDSQWKLLMDACQANLGASPPDWLDARNQIRRFLRRGDSINLVVQGRPKWKELIANLSSSDDPEGAITTIAQVDLESGATASREGLVREIVRALGGATAIPTPPNDLVELDRFLVAQHCSLLALLRFDYAGERPSYGVDLFAALRHLATDKRVLQLIIQSRSPLEAILPRDHPMSSSFTSLKRVVLRGNP